LRPAIKRGGIIKGKERKRKERDRGEGERERERERDGGERRGKKILLRHASAASPFRGRASRFLTAPGFRARDKLAPR
jgi:hypothetical protein